MPSLIPKQSPESSPGLQLLVGLLIITFTLGFGSHFLRELRPLPVSEFAQTKGTVTSHDVLAHMRGGSPRGTRYGPRV